MFSLRSNRGHVPTGSGVVLPRWLRRPVRALRRLHVGEINAPRFGATIATATLVSLSILYGGIKGGHVDEVVSVITARTGFAIDDIQVTGNIETSEIDILQQIGLDGWTSMVGFDVELARQRIAELPWVESVEVRKIYPATVEVQIVERKAFALWQRDNQLHVIEQSGNVIAPFSGGRLAALPMVIGIGADTSGASLVRQVSGFPSIASNVRAYIRIANRRWDLRLENGVTVKLPERGVDEALGELAQLQGNYDLFNRSIEVVDLRLTDRITVALTSDAVSAREQAFKEMMARRKKGAKI